MGILHGPFRYLTNYCDCKRAVIWVYLFGTVKVEPFRCETD